MALDHRLSDHWRIESIQDHNPSMSFLQRDGRRIYFEESGSGPAVVLGHSFLCSTEMWCEQVGRLAEAHRVVNIDYRGHGQSDPAHEPFSLYDLLDDTLAVLDHLGIERASWVGLSTGGMVAMRAAILHPARVRSMVLMDTDGGAERPWVALKYRAMVLGARLLGIRPFIPSVLSLMFGRTTLRESKPLVERWRPRLMEPDLATISNWVDALVERDSLASQLEQVEVPALVVVGEEDRSLPPAIAKDLARRLPRSKLVVIPRAGHLSALEQPEAVNRAILSFLREVEES